MTLSGAKKSGHTHGEICFSLGQYRKVINPLCTVKAGSKFIPQLRNHSLNFGWLGWVVWPDLWRKVGWQGKAERKRLGRRGGRWRTREGGVEGRRKPGTKTTDRQAESPPGRCLGAEGSEPGTEVRAAHGCHLLGPALPAVPILKSFKRNLLCSPGWKYIILWVQMLWKSTKDVWKT